MTTSTTTSLFAGAALAAALLAASPHSAAVEACPSLLNHKFTTLQGKPANLCQYSGKTVLIVNTASYCGYTKQYEGLQAIYDKYRERGLVIVGFPANDFGKQEPGSNAEVADFCERTYKVKFPMMEKTAVVGADTNPLHEALFKATGERPKWNFHKYLIAPDGKTVKSFPSNVAPESAVLVSQIEAALATK